MRDHFRRIFHPTEKEQKEDIELCRKIFEESTERRANLLAERDGLFVSEPFQSFYGDCTWCEQYIDPDRGFITGGYCLENNCGCGHGFTCRKFAMRKEIIEEAEMLGIALPDIDNIGGK